MITLSSLPSQEVTPLTVRGKLSFYCCGFNTTLELLNEWKIRCPRCHTLYTLSANPLDDQTEEEVFKPGLTVRLLEATEVMAASNKVKLAKGLETLIAFDPYNVIPVQPDEVLIEVQFTKDITVGLVAPIKKTLLEIRSDG
jgi:hypothetical protein